MSSPSFSYALFLFLCFVTPASLARPPSPHTAKIPLGYKCGHEFYSQSLLERSALEAHNAYQKFIETGTKTSDFGYPKIYEKDVASNRLETLIEWPLSYSKIAPWKSGPISPYILVMDNKFKVVTVLRKRKKNGDVTCTLITGNSINSINDHNPDGGFQCGPEFISNHLAKQVATEILSKVHSQRGKNKFAHLKEFENPKMFNTNLPLYYVRFTSEGKIYTRARNYLVVDEKCSIVALLTKPEGTYTQCLPGSHEKDYPMIFDPAPKVEPEEVDVYICGDKFIPIADTIKAAENAIAAAIHTRTTPNQRKSRKIPLVPSGLFVNLPRPLYYAYIGSRHDIVGYYILGSTRLGDSFAVLDPNFNVLGAMYRVSATKFAECYRKAVGESTLIPSKIGI